MKYAEPTLTNKKDDSVVAVMHGENFLTPAETTLKGKWTKHDMFVVGHSESGHHHILDGEIEVLETPNMDKDIFIRLLKPTNLYHKKPTDIHATVTVEPGTYKITHKTEYNPFTKVLQRVFD